MGFHEAVNATPHLHDKWKAGLGALHAQGRKRIKLEDTSSERLRGSVDIDTALKSLQQQAQANRWDFAIGYQHANRSDEFVYWVETHTGSDSEVKVVLRKLAWLKRWMKSDGRRLARFDHQFVWIPSGATSFTSGATQVRQLADSGIHYSGTIFRIPVTHKKAKP